MLKLKFSRKGCKAFFKKHPQAKKLAQTKITTAITKEVQTGMTKSQGCHSTENQWTSLL